MAQGDISAVKALTFDVFGTVVDWRGSLIREGMEFGTAHGLSVDWARFADDWRRWPADGICPATHGTRSRTYA